LIHIVGIGPGDKNYILPEALTVLKDSEMVLGFQRAIESIKFLQVESRVVKSLSELLQIIKSNSELNIAIAASGDPCFYGVTNYIKENYDGKFIVIPGISSFQYMACKLNMSWQGAFLGSLHGRSTSFLSKVMENKLSIWLTDNVNSPEALAEELYKNQINAKIYIGENLSYEDEKITCGTSGELKGMTFPGLSVIIIENREMETQHGLYK
jgi:precorrin-6y C5,15-methyltransferase (decarboxylating) CbiE subunit